MEFQASLVLCIEERIEALHFCPRKESVDIHWVAHEEWTCCIQVELDVICSRSSYSPGYLATLTHTWKYPSNWTPEMPCISAQDNNEDIFKENVLIAWVSLTAAPDKIHLIKISMVWLIKLPYL